MNITPADRELAEGIAAAHPLEVPQLRPYVVILRKPNCWPRIKLDVMDTDSFAAAEKHDCLCVPGERPEAMTEEHWTDLRIKLDRPDVYGSPAYNRGIEQQVHELNCAGRLWPRGAA